MSFLFSLKGKVGKQPRKAEASKRMAFVAEVEDPKKKSIDSFDVNSGAMQGLIAISHKPELIINPINKSTRLRRVADPRGNGVEGKTSQDEATRSLLSGETLETADSRTIPLHKQLEHVDAVLGAENTPKDYEDVPVEEFGAALLRGMGWKGPDKETPSLHTRHRQRGAILGIGAKPMSKELELELLDRKNLSVPMIERQDK